MTTIYFAGGEDSDHFNVGGGGVTTSARFRSNARCSLNLNAAGGYWQNAVPFSLSSFFFSTQVSLGTAGSTLVNTANAPLVSFIDANGVTRLQIVANGQNSWNSTPQLMKIQKVSAAGVITTLATTSTTVTSPPSNITGITDQWIADISYSTTGHFNFYIGGSLLLSFSGDVTTDGQTLLAGYRVSNGANTSAGWNGAAGFNWSEMIVTDTFPLGWSLQTLVPTANGNTHNFDTAAVANVNEVTLNDLTQDQSGTAGQIDQYTVPAIAGGNPGILAIGISARAAKGASGPSKMDLGVRSGSTDYWSSDISLTQALGCYQNWWLTDPNTSTGWSGLPVNIGLKSVT